MLKLRHGIVAGLFVLGIVLLDPVMSTGQPGGGFGGKGGKGGKRGFGGQGFGGGQGYGGGGFGGKGGGFGGRAGGGRGGNPESTFALFAGQNGQVIDMSRMSSDSKSVVQRSFQKMGMTPPSDNAVITKAQFLESYGRQQARASGGSGQSMAFGASGNSGVKMYSGGAEVTMTPAYGNNYQYPMGRGMGGMDRGRGNFNGPRGFNGQDQNASFDRRGQQGGMGRFGDKSFGDRGGDKSDRSFRFTDQDLEKKFASLDFNHDDRLSQDEIPENIKLAQGFKEFDKDGDGYIDLTEYKAYVATQLNSDPDVGSYGSFAGGNYGKEKKEELSVAIRYGKLPAGLPSWWTELDTDKDGNVGLYEWRADGRDMKEFIRMDLDGDSMLAPQEWQRFNIRSAQEAKAFAAQEDIDGVSDGPSAPRAGFTPGRGGSGNRSFGPPGGSGSSRGFPIGNPYGRGKGAEKGSKAPDRGKNFDKTSDGGKNVDSRDSDGGDRSSNPFRAGGRKRN